MGNVPVHYQELGGSPFLWTASHHPCSSLREERKNQIENKVVLEIR
jgi:hypothetical protein